MPKGEVYLRQATKDDISGLLTLLNQCYREDVGWTNEAHLIGGIRTTAEELQSVIDDKQHYLFVYPQVSTNEADPDKSSHDNASHPSRNQESGQILGCIAVKFKQNSHDCHNNHKSYPSAYIGTFAVHPNLQGQGVGNQILQAAETFAIRHLSSDAMGTQTDDTDKPKSVCLTMSVLEQRPKLFAYYQRRGYEPTGQGIPFPEDGNNGEPKQQGLKLMELAKWV